MFLEKIFDEIKKNDWSFLIAHTLGVDHCGHRYGITHSEMARKLRQMDHLIQNITQTMTDDTILFVMGDHGMTNNGDHGGDSLQEIESALFVYSKKANFQNEKEIQTVEQVDFVPTLSLLLDIPIPFSNLGLVIKSLIPHERYFNALKLNSIQIMRYAQQYNVFEPNIEVIFIV